MHNTMSMRRPLRLRRAAAVAMAAFGLGVGALAAPAASDAAVCSSGEFCLWEGTINGSGLYHSPRSDGTLWNDYFTNRPCCRRVANATHGFWNRGTTAGGPAHVRLFTGVYGSGSHTCAPRGSRGYLGYDNIKGVSWINNVESFEWRYSC
jgi:hypothetical protein